MANTVDGTISSLEQGQTKDSIVRPSPTWRAALYDYESLLKPDSGSEYEPDSGSDIDIHGKS